MKVKKLMDKIQARILLKLLEISRLYAIINRVKKYRVNSTVSLQFEISTIEDFKIKEII
jgi:hypothetical protein